MFKKKKNGNFDGDFCKKELMETCVLHMAQKHLDCEMLVFSALCVEVMMIRFST